MISHNDVVCFAKLRRFHHALDDAYDGIATHYRVSKFLIHPLTEKKFVFATNLHV